MTSVVLAIDWRVADFEQWWTKLAGGRDQLHELGVRHYVLYRAFADPDRVFITLGLHAQGRMDRLVSSPAVLEWFDTAGTAEIPPMFIGSPVHKLSYVDGPDRADADRSWPAGAVIVAAIVRVPDFDTYLERVHATADRAIAAGVRQFWIYRALDEPDEVMSLQQVDTRTHADAWLRRPEAVAEFYRSAGTGVYPPLFVGALVDVIELEAP